MKKVLLWTGLLLLSPFLLFAVLTALLYLPPVQNWAVDKVAAIASDKTGMHIGVGHVELKFPLDLSVDNVLVTRPHNAPSGTGSSQDTVACIGRAVVDVQLLPLLSKQVVVDELTLEQAHINTQDFISDVQVSGFVGQLSVAAHGIDLNEGTVQLNGALLSDADVLVVLSDTAAADTTTSEVPWLIRADSLSILRSRVEVHMPGDTMQMTASMGRLSAKDGVVDLLNGVYTVASLDWDNGSLTYDQTRQPRIVQGMDYGHIALSDVNIGLDSVFFSQPNLSLKIRRAALKEQSGLQISRLTGGVLIDSVGIQLPNLQLATPYSNIRARAEADFNVMDSVAPGQLHADVQASLGKQDLMLFMADMPQRLRTQWPEWPLSLQAKIDGNMQQAYIDRLDAVLLTAFHIMASGHVANLNDTDHLLAQIDMQAEAYDLNFATALLPRDAMASVRIPKGIGLSGNVEADGPRYKANLTARQGKGTVRARGWLNTRNMSYDADVSISRLNLHQFLPKQSLHELTAHVKAKGQGTDFTSKRSQLDATASIEHLRYGQLDIDSMQATAQLHNGHALVSATGRNKLFSGTLSADALLGTNNLSTTLTSDIAWVDLRAMNMVEKPLKVGLCGQIDLNSNLADRHTITGLISDIYIDDSLHLYRPEDVGLYLRTQPDTTLLRTQSGNLIVKMDASGGYEPLLNQLAALADTMTAQYHNRIIDQGRIKQMLPTMRLYVSSGQENPFASMLKASANTHFKELLVDVSSSPEHGINGTSHVLALNADSTRIDTITLNLKDSSHGLTFQGVVANNRRNPQFVFRTLIDGHIYERGARMGVRFFDDKNRLGLRLGASAAMEENGIGFHLMPSRPTIGYKEFKLNDDNFLLLRNDLKLQAKIDLIADDGTGVKIYSEHQDSTMLQDLTVSLHRFDLEKLSSVLPYMPRISGILEGDYHLIMNQQKQISVASDMQVKAFTYEGNPIGNLSTEFVYLQRDDDTHAVEGVLMLDEKRVARLQGEYVNQDAGYLNAKLALERFPLSMVNGFIPQQIIGFEGLAEGEMSINGPMKTPQVDGEVLLDSAFLISKPYGVRLRFDNDPVRIINSKLLLENFTMYAHNENPLNIMGEIDFHNTDRITLDMRMRARNYQLVNSRQTKESVAFGKAFVNFFARMNGRLDQLHMRGRLDVLGTTDMTYLLLDSPLSTDNQMDELVRFTDFSDSTQITVEKPKPEGLDVDMTISIDQGAHVVCGLNADQSNYVDLFGGGNLRMLYSNNEITLNGRYTVQNGEMKYSLPIIPLKTFTIQDGSYVEFTGDPMNPRLNLTATERTKASVATEGQQGRSVAFDCGVVITKTLQDMGLAFIISAPEDMSVQNDLNSMTAEQQGKLAVTMLTTGMYLADGNTSGFSMNSALSSFLQSEINNITGNALKTLDLSIGIDNTTDASGAMHTDYSFKFAKRFWNNRLKVQIGGKVSSGTEAQGQKQSFFDNVTMEYRLSPTSNQYVKLFYNQNVYDWLEGYTSEYGGGYIWKRKLDKFWDILKIWSSEKTQQNLPARERNSLPQKNDSVKNNKQ